MIDTVLFILAVLSMLGLLGMLICTIAFILFDKNWIKTFIIFGWQTMGCIVLGMMFLLLSEII